MHMPAQAEWHTPVLAWGNSKRNCGLSDMKHIAFQLASKSTTDSQKHTRQQQLTDPVFIVAWVYLKLLPLNT